MKNRFSHFDKAGGIHYGFSSKTDGSMRPTDPDLSKHQKEFLASAGLSDKKLMRTKQVHGSQIVSVSHDLSEPQEADGMITGLSDVVLGMVSADCVPVLFYDPKKKIVALVHAGWKGITQGIISETMKSFLEAGTNVSDILVGIGPSIRSCCYSVDGARVSVFEKTFPLSSLEKNIETRNSICYLSLQGVIVRELQKLGILQNHIEDLGICTACSGEYFSYRASTDKTNFAEFLSVIAIHE